MAWHIEACPHRCHHKLTHFVTVMDLVTLQALRRSLQRSQKRLPLQQTEPS